MQRGRVVNSNRFASPASPGLGSRVEPRGISWRSFFGSRGRKIKDFGVPGASWGRRGASWGRLRASWGRLGGLLGPLGRNPGEPVKTCKNLRKIKDLGGPGGVLGASWGLLGRLGGLLGGGLGSPEGLGGLLEGFCGAREWFRRSRGGFPTSGVARPSTFCRPGLPGGG